VAESKTATKGTRRSAKRTSPTKKYEGFTDQEKAAMKERARELKAEARADRDRAAGERDVLAKIAEMPEPDRSMAERLHEIIKASAPDLSPKICFFQSAQKYDSRYSTFGFQDAANLDQGAMWPTSWALTELTAVDEKKIAALVKKAVS
jgi:uncharacterized protein YdhG (YjbR/CyaY superfamily)